MSNTERPPLWRVMNLARVMAIARGAKGDGKFIVGGTTGFMCAAEIRAVRQWLIDAGYVSAAGGKATPGSDARMLEALEHEARRAEAGE